MSTPAVQLPDAELLLTGWLRSLPQLSGVRVVTDLPRDLEQQLPLLWVTRIGGGRRQYLLDNPRFDVDGFGLTRTAARNLVAAVETQLPTLRGTTTGGATVGYIEIETATSWRPDWNERVRRAGLTFSAILRAG